MDEKLRDALLEVMECSLDAQLRAVRRLRTSVPDDRKGAVRSKKSGRSQVDMAYDVLTSGQPLHIQGIIAAIRERFGVEVDRESLVSALSKRVTRADRFQRIAKNTFSLINPPTP